MEHFFIWKSLTLIPLLSPDMTALDDLWVGALWTLHSASGEKTFFYSNRMQKISTAIER